MAPPFEQCSSMLLFLYVNEGYFLRDKDIGLVQKEDVSFKYPSTIQYTHNIKKKTIELQ